MTEEVLRYKQSGSGFSDLHKRICLFVYRYPQGRLNWTEDECGDFFLFFYPKIPGLIRRFEYRGKPFEAYLAGTLRWQAKTFAQEQKRLRRRCQLLERQDLWVVEEEEPKICASKPLSMPKEMKRIIGMTRDGKIATESKSKRLLFLILKECQFIDDTFLHYAADITGCEFTKLCSCVESLKAKLQKRKMRIAALEERRNKAFFRCNYLEERLRMCIIPEEQENLARAITRLKQSLSHTREALARVPLSPTHRDIAEVLGIPKGTVDSGLFYLKSDMKTLYSNKKIGYAPDA